MACTGPRMAACIGIAGIGIPALASLTLGPHPLALALAILALTLPALGGQAWILASLLPLPAAVSTLVAPSILHHLAVLSILGQTAYTLHKTRRLHSLAMLVALAPVVRGPEEAALAAVLTVALGMVAATRIVEESGCPFKSENRLLQAGALLSGSSLVAAALGGWSPLTATLWLLGLLLLEAGVLAPRGS